MTEIEACLALNLIPNMGPVRLRKLLARFGTPQQVLEANSSELRTVEGIGPEMAAAIAAWPTQIDLSGELRLIEEFGARIITQNSPEYPPSLREIHNPPIVLYVWGDLREGDRHAIGVVGSRRTSHYGLASAKKLSYQLAYAGLTVVSGLARGIDTAAHQGALAAEGRTVAVIGSGLMDLYPPENQALAEKITSSGAVVSEFPMKFPPSQQTFPYRNRIVAGWGSGVLVVEAGLSSGALITANQALENGRLVYAVPGPIDRPTSMGGNRLIQQGAKLVMGAGDILDDLQSLFPEMPQSPKAAEVSLTDQEADVLAQIQSDETALDAIVNGCELPLPKVSAILLSLEMKRLVKQLPGQHFVRTSLAG
jgi:DNA processing protein